MSWVVVLWKHEWAGPHEEWKKKPGSARYWDGKGFVKDRSAAKTFKWPNIARIVARAHRAEVERQ